MKYYINPSFSMMKKGDNEILVSCSDYLREYSCDFELLNDILRIIKKTSSIDGIYEKYQDTYSKDEIDEFLEILFKEGVVKKKERQTGLAKIAIIGEQSYFMFLKKHMNIEIEIKYFSDIKDYIASKDEWTGAILLPGELKYGEILAVNKKLVEKGIPFAVYRYNGDNFVAGPLVFPWKTPCLECHIQQHISLLNRDLEKSFDINAIKELNYSQEWDDTFTNAEKDSILQILLKDMLNVSKEKANFALYKKEIIFSKEKIYEPLIKRYEATSECTCCRNMNKKYVWNNNSVSVPKMINPLDGSQIKYQVGGLRSKSKEETANLVKDTLEKMDLDIKIEVDLTNPFADIIPVYHSTLEMTHKNKTPYFFGQQHSHGKGINKKQAYFSASFEMFERLSARYFGEKELICGTFHELEPYCADVSDMTKVVDHVETVYDCFDKDKEVDWVWGYSLVENRPKLIPASLVFLSRNTFKGNFAPIGSSGMSAGATIKDAILQGLFELLEHDAWMIGQANTVRLPIIEYNGLQNTELKEVISKIKNKGFEIISRDYTNDIGIPVIRTWIANPKDYANYAFSGFGASIYPELALERSITEAVQSRASVHEADVEEYASLDMEYLISARDGLYSLFYFQQKDIVPIGKRKDIGDMQSVAFESVDQSIEYVISKIKAVQPDADILYVDLTREGIDIPVVKVFVTKGTQLMGEPLLVPSKRLFEFQMNMGYSKEQPKYTELYLAPYPH
ncbi:MAG: YcaO-like family protein [Roseburia sp.]